MFYIFQNPKWRSIFIRCPQVHRAALSHWRPLQLDCNWTRKFWTWWPVNIWSPSFWRYWILWNYCLAHLRDGAINILLSLHRSIHSTRFPRSTIMASACGKGKANFILTFILFSLLAWSSDLYKSNFSYIHFKCKYSFHNFWNESFRKHAFLNVCTVVPVKVIIETRITRNAHVLFTIHRVLYFLLANRRSLQAFLI